MQVLSVEHIWDQLWGQQRHRVQRTVTDDQGNVSKTTEYYYYTVYNRQGQIEQSQPPTFDQRA